jgi:hypothetical protein
MLSFPPRALFVLSVLVLSACSGSAGSNATPPAGSNQTAAVQSVDSVLDSAPEVVGGRILMKKISVQPDAKAPPTLINFVANGPAQGGLPCISCVNGASTNDNIGLTGPSSYVLSNTYWQYALSFTDISYKGNCKLAWAITTSNKTLDSFAKTLGVTGSGFVLYAFNRPRPKYSGPATLTGKVTCGGNPSQSLKAPLQFQ